MKRIKVNGVELCVETFGDPADPPVLAGRRHYAELAGRELCAALAGRYVVRYDLRDACESTFVDPDAPAYDLRDLVTDASELLVALDLGRTHVVGVGVGGFIAQLVRARPSRPGCVADAGLHPPGRARSGRSRLAGPRGGDEEAAVRASGAGLDRSRQRGRLHDRFRAGDVRVAGIRRAGRTGGCRIGLRPSGPDGEGAACEPSRAACSRPSTASRGWRERLGEITVPTLVVHGDEDPFFPHGNGVALAAEIPGATLLTLPGIGQGVPRVTWPDVVDALLRHTSDTPRGT